MDALDLTLNMLHRILTGIQSSGTPHLGNVLGAIRPAITLVDKIKNDKSLFFIADLHTLTSLKDGAARQTNVLDTAAAWLACGLDTKKSILFRQSQVPQVCELAWYLNCFVPYPMLANAHSFKDKSSKLADVNAGLFTYPVLMAADILLYDTTLVPVGKDQLQHLEIARDVARSFNGSYSGEIFKIPEAYVEQSLAIVPGTDGQKMSKSYKNTIAIFAEEKRLKDDIMSIKTDSTPLTSPKDYESCTVFALYQILAESDKVEEMKEKYRSSNYGFGHAKKELLDLMVEKFSKERELFDYYKNNPKAVYEILQDGEARANAIATEKMQRVRTILGYN